MKYRHFLFLTAFAALAACSISYKFNGASIDYEKTKTIQIDRFINQAPLVYPPLEQAFNDALQDKFIQNTRLQLVKNNGDMELAGEITGYQLTPMAVQEDAFASETRLTMTVRIRFKNNKVEGKDQESTFSAYRNFDSSQMLTDVQDQLISEMNKDIVDQIFNATMADW
ncbi:MAG: LPS assembly lipoprotein LptE [Dysgonamonadaceae bacterium]|jgi:outer membrane lipopolysaccharide assembly protein LptE/RlpB|nr:LPS assembly lipoprotein LptE [Dysgonamonadaceae bacterium]